MACQTAPSASQARPVAAFRRRTRDARHHIRRIQNAKRMIIGEITPGPLAGLQKDFEKVLELFGPVLSLLVSGYLDGLSDEELKSTLKTLQDTNDGISHLLRGAANIGLEGRAPFPKLLFDLRENQERLRSQIEGILLSLDDSFGELIKKSASALHIPA
jgi:hypothetical protein